MKTKMKQKVRIAAPLRLLIVMAAAMLAGCGGSGSSGGASHATNAARVVGLVAVEAGNAALARPAGEATLEEGADGEDRAAERAAAQAASSCGALPAGYVAVPNATVTDSGGATTTTDANGCFSMSIKDFGTHIFTVTKTNSAGGVTTLKKAATVGENANVTLTDTNAITLQSTIAAIIVEQKLAAGEKDVVPADVEAYVETIKDQDDIKALETAVVASAGANPTTPFSKISDTTVTSGEATTEKPVVVGATVTGSPVAAAGGDVNIKCKAAAFSTTIKSVTASLATTDGTPVFVALANTAGNNYAATYTLAVNAGATLTYSVTITAVDAKDVSNSYSTASLSITQTAGIVPPRCGDGTVDTGEVCDSGASNTNTACSATYGSTCSYCDTFCQTQTVTGPRCGDSTVNTGNGETCDAGSSNTNTACTAAYGSTCTYCNTSCLSQTVTGASCGDGTINGTETCDSGANNTNTACAASYGSTCNYCNTSCASQTVTGSRCGDSAVNAGNGEQCDDGNTASSDGCSSTCQTETPAITQVSAANNSTCVLLNDKTVKCVGNNGDGELGNGTTTNSKWAVSVTGLSSVEKISSGAGSAGGARTFCALMTGGTIKCWGSNGYGQLGNGSTTSSSTPVTVSGISNAAAVVAGERHTCALITGGTAKCWGANYTGGLGDGTTTNSLVPVDVSGVSGIVNIALSTSSTCAVLSGGSVKCWGAGASGQLGNGASADSSTPVTVSGITTAVQVTGGTDMYCALLQDGTVQCWGYSSGGLGDGSSTSSNIPVTVSGLSGVSKIAAYGYGTADSGACAVLTSGSIKCWGSNSGGNFGNGTTANSNTPVSVQNITTATDVHASGNHTCARLSDGTVKCWGKNSNFELGTLTATDSTTPVTFIITGVCGDSLPYAGEQCDFGAANGTNGLCTSTCQSTGVCGNGYVDAGEACDDGNTVDTDACSNTCVAGGCAAHTDMMVCMNDFANGCMWLGGSCQAF